LKHLLPLLLLQPLLLTPLPQLLLLLLTPLPQPLLLLLLLLLPSKLRSSAKKADPWVGFFLVLLRLPLKNLAPAKPIQLIGHPDPFRLTVQNPTQCSPGKLRLIVLFTKMRRNQVL